MSKLSKEARERMSFTGGPPPIGDCRKLCDEIEELERLAAARAEQILHLQSMLEDSDE